MGEKQLRETPTERPALASSLCYLDPACLKDAWPCVGESAERIGGGRRAGITQGGISLCRSFSACRRLLRQAGARQPAVVLSGSTSTVPYGRAIYYSSSYSSAPRRRSGITVTTIATTMAASI